MSRSLRKPIGHAESIVAKVNEPRGVDPLRIKDAERARLELSAPSRELFRRLFAERNRERLIFESLNIVRSVVAKHVKATQQRWAFDDLESVATIAAIKAVDQLLSNGAGENPGSYIWDAVHGAVVEPDSDLHSRPFIVVRPRGEKGKYVRVETPWPEGALKRDKDGMFTGARGDWEPGRTIQGQRIQGKPMPAEARVSRTDDDWGFLAEICNDEEMLILQLLSHGHTREYVAKAIGCHESTITEKINRIKERVQSYTDKDR
jgi:hypothetical protein